MAAVATVAFASCGGGESAKTADTTAVVMDSTPVAPADTTAMATDSAATTADTTAKK
ncbi:MAG TPA: hypothetical protein VNB90_09460 [Cytophagaceae bacterium]|nr:hypothetical protein [Cytophagaceae bacterium]